MVTIDWFRTHHIHRKCFQMIDDVFIIIIIMVWMLMENWEERVEIITVSEHVLYSVLALWTLISISMHSMSGSG